MKSTDAENATLPGMPGPTVEGVQRKKTVDRIFDMVHSSLVSVAEGLPAKQSKITISRIVKGDKITIQFTPGE